MSDPTIFRIPVGSVGAFGLALVDRAAVGYADTWQAPDGATLPSVTQADYEAGSTTWQCQLTSAALTAAANIQTNDRPATICTPPGQTVVVGEDAFTLDVEQFQDANVAVGLQAFLFANRTKEAYFYFSADGPDGAPRAIGRVRLTSSTFGGAAYTDLTATLSLPLVRAPDIEFGSGSTTTIVTGAGSQPITGVVAGTPGHFTPTGVTPPANLTALKADPVVGDAGTNKPGATPWTTGQNVALGTGTAYWNGTAWVTGTAP